MLFFKMKEQIVIICKFSNISLKLQIKGLPYMKFFNSDRIPLAFIGILLTSSAMSHNEIQLNPIDYGYDVTGHYTSEVKTGILVTVVGESLQVVTAKGIAEITKKDGKFYIEESVCKISIESQIDSKVSDKVPQSAQPVTSEIVFSENLFGELTWRKKESVSTLGLKLDNPKTDIFPKKPTDIRIIDQESDGNPGYTISINSPILSGKVYNIQRSFTAYKNGSMSFDGELTGTNSTRTEQLVVGASKPTLNKTPKNRPDTKPENNLVKLVKTESKPSCR